MSVERRVATADDIAQLDLRLTQLEQGLNHVEVDIHAIDRRQRPYGDGTSDAEVARRWPNNSRRRR